MLWACLLLPHLALDGVLRQRAPKGPLVLVDGPPHARTLVAVNAAARAAGLRVGQRLAAAQALLAQFEVVPCEARDIAHSHALLASTAYRYSGEVCLLPKAVVLEVSRSQSLFGAWPQIARRLHEDVDALGFRHRLAAAPTPHAAWVLAGFQDGIVAESPAHSQRLLEAVPLERAHLRARDIETLARVGIRTLGQLWRRREPDCYADSVPRSLTIWIAWRVMCRPACHCTNRPIKWIGAWSCRSKSRTRPRWYSRCGA